jgi:hypothetical protein
MCAVRRDHDDIWVDTSLHARTDTDAVQDSPYRWPSSTVELSNKVVEFSPGVREENLMPSPGRHKEIPDKGGA